VLARLSSTRGLVVIGPVGDNITLGDGNDSVTGGDLVTHCQPWEGWALAIGIDVGFIALELRTHSIITATILSAEPQCSSIPDETHRHGC
jgi:hypothetical protein